MNSVETPQEPDVVIIGAGASGLSAAILLGRSRRRVVVVDSNSPRNAPAAQMRGFITNDGLPPRDFLAQGRAEAEAYGVTILNDAVTSVDNNRTIHLESGASIRPRRVLVATGLVDELPELPGVAERWGRDVKHCGYCHGYEIADRNIAVLGTRPETAFQAMMMRQWTPNTTFINHAQALSDEHRNMLHARGVTIIEGTIDELVIRDDQLDGVRVEGKVHPFEAVFVLPHMRPRDEFLAELNCERDDMGFLRVNDDWRTSTEWVYAAGNCTDIKAQAVTAAGQGSAAGIAINLDLAMEDTANDVAQGAAS